MLVHVNDHIMSSAFLTAHGLMKLSTRPCISLGRCSYFVILSSHKCPRRVGFELDLKFKALAVHHTPCGQGTKRSDRKLLGGLL